MRFIVPLFIISIGIPACADAQAVRGSVVDTLSGQPAGHGFVVLLDGSGREVARALTGRDGRFEISAPAVGVYTLRSERIGYRLWETQPFRLAADLTYEVVMPIAALPAELDALEVVGETSCEDPTGNFDTGALWEEARKALAAASWTSGQRGYRQLLHGYRRLYDRRRREVLFDSIYGYPVRALVPYVATPADSLAEFGFIVQDGPATAVYHGLDANVLLHDAFHRTHCFSAVRGEEEFAGWLGLEFVPVPDRELPDVRGTLWIDETSSELRRIEYEYVNAPARIEHDAFGGTIRFRRLANGAWVVERWEIRVPRLERSRRGRPRIESFSDEGGQVVELFDLDGYLLYRSPETAVITGAVFDSITGAFLAEERVAIDGMGYETLTDANGRYTIKGILRGEYSITSGRLESLGYRPGQRRFTAEPGDTVNVDIVVPGMDAVHRSLCATGWPAGTRALVGIVTDAAGERIADTWVAATWSEPGREQRRLQRTRTDEDGRYVLCYLPEQRELSLEVLLEDRDDPLVEVFFRGDWVDVTVGLETSQLRVPEHILQLNLVTSD